MQKLPSYCLPNPRLQSHRQVSLLLLVSFVICYEVFVSIPVAHASCYIANCSTYGPYYVGAIVSATPNGAQANIYNYQPRYCQHSSAWAMVYSNLGGTTSYLAQVGWERSTVFTDTNPFFFWEYANASDAGPHKYADVPNPTSYGYSTKYAVWFSSNTTALFTVNNVGIGNATLNWSPDNAAWMAETHFPEDQTAGDVAHYEVFTGVQYLQSGSWHNINAAYSSYNNTPYGTGYWGSGNSFDVWDTRYNSEG